MLTRLSLNPQCGRPPLGWRCTRGLHLDGPCAAVPTWWNSLLWRFTGRCF